MFRAPDGIRHNPLAGECGTWPIVTDAPANEQRAIARQDACAPPWY
jgi:hypothetical protein